jgi:hypothetical protein
MVASPGVNPLGAQKILKSVLAGHLWFMPIILTIQRLGGSWFKDSPGKKFVRPYLNQ